jgi:hypothetical protein
VKTTKKLLNQSGQGMLEYVLILVIVLAIAGLFRNQIKSAIDGLVGKTSGEITNFGNQ